MHHPKTIEYEEMMLDSRHRFVNPAGHWDQIGAQERVVLRRHLREFYPKFAANNDLREYDKFELSTIIDDLVCESMSKS